MAYKFNPLTGKLDYYEVTSLEQARAVNNILLGDMYLSSGIVTAAGTTQGTATALTKQYNFVTAGSGGVVLPTPTGAGLVYVIDNDLATALNVYPATGGLIDGMAANAPKSIGVYSTLYLVSESATEWVTIAGSAAFIPTDSTLPIVSTIPKGQSFFHAPAGRNVLMQYDGTVWQPVLMLGASTLYVDIANGTDNKNNGYGTGTSAYKTIQYAINQIAGIVGGNVVINVAAGTYAESVNISGKSFTGAYTITLQGSTTNSDTGTATLGANPAGNGSGGYGTLTNTGKAYTVNAYKNLFIEITGGLGVGQVYPIHANTATVVTIVGRWVTVPNNTSAYRIFSLSSIVNGAGLSSCVKVTNSQQGIVLKNLKLMNAGNAVDTGGLLVSLNSQCDINQCHIENCSYWNMYYTSGATGKFTGVVSRLSIIGDLYVDAGASIMSIKQCRFTGQYNRSIGISFGYVFDLRESYIGEIAGGAGIVGIYVYQAGFLGTDAYFELDGMSSHGIDIFNNGTYFTNGVWGNPSTQVIKNCTGWGIYSGSGGVYGIDNISSITYSGNILGTYSAIDTELYNPNGSPRISSHCVEGSVVLVSGAATVTLTVPAAFTSATSYTVNVTRSANTNSFKVVNNSGSSFTITSAVPTDADTVRYVATGD